MTIKKSENFCIRNENIQCFVKPLNFKPELMLVTEVCTRYIMTSKLLRLRLPQRSRVPYCDP